MIFGAQPFGGDTFANGIADVDPDPAECGNDFLLAGMRWLANKLPTTIGTSVVFQRDTAKTSVCVTFGRTLLRYSDEFGGTKIEWTDKDFIVPAANLQIGGAAVLPKRGDRFKVNDGQTICIYEVLPYGTEPHWRWSDPFRKLIRIHTKLITTEPAP